MPLFVRSLLAVLAVGISVSAGDLVHGLLGQTEIEQLGLAAFGHEDVRRLDVAVDDLLRMGRVQRVGDLRSPDRAPCSISIGLPPIVCFERLPFHHLHRDERTPFVLADLVDRADVGMVQRRSGSRLPPEALQRLRALATDHRAGTSAQRGV